MSAFGRKSPRSYTKYRRDFDYSYTLGIFPSLELLSARPSSVIKVFLHSKSDRNEGAEKIRLACRLHGIELEYNDKQIEFLSPKENCLGIAVFRKYDSELIRGNDHLLLVNPSNAGNLGTILRTMLAFGFHDLAIVSPGVDIFHPGTVRSSMGAVFQVRWQYFNSLGHYLSGHPNHLYPLMTDGREEIRNIRCRRPFTLILGKESCGLDRSFDREGTSIRIPQSGDVDSLNLAVAAGIALYHVSQNNAGK